MDAALVILAAGLGSRYGGLKQIEPIGKDGEIIADFSVFDAKRAGFGKVVFVIKKETEKDFCERIINRIAKNFCADYVFQETDDLPGDLTPPQDRIKPWGTGHAVLCAMKKINGNFAVVNADDFYGYDTFKKLANFLAVNKAGSHCLVGFSLKNTVTEHGSVARGICSVKDGYLTRIDETLNIRAVQTKIFTRNEYGGNITLDNAGIVSMNAWGFHLSAVKRIEESFAVFLKDNISSPTAEFYLPQAVTDMINAGDTVKVISGNEKWYGITYKEDAPLVKSAVDKMFKNGIYPEKLWEKNF